MKCIYSSYLQMPPLLSSRNFIYEISGISLQCVVLLGEEIPDILPTAKFLYVRYSKRNNLDKDIIIIGKCTFNYAIIQTNKSTREMSLQKTYKVIAKPYERKERFC